VSSAKLQKQGDVVKQQIKGGERQSFLVTLTTGQYASVRVEQHGAILLITLFDPQGKEIILMDNPSGGHGPIIISTIAPVSGDYRIEVFSKDSWANPAGFEVVLDELRSPRADGQTIIEGQQAFAEGRKNSRADNPSAALTHYERALALWTTANDQHWLALTHFALSEAYRTIGERERPNAIKELETVLAIVNVHMAPNDWRIKAAALNDLGAQYIFAGEVERGISLLKEAFDLFSSHQDQRGEASSLNNLALAYRTLGNFSLARELVERAVPLREAENDRAGVINLKNSLGGASDGLGEPDKALQYFEEALREWQKLGELKPPDRRRVATLFNNLAVASDKLGQWDKARDYYDQALSMMSEGDPGRPATLDSKGELYASLGDLKKARECYDQALALLPTEKFNLDLKVGILVHVGQLFFRQGDLTNAVSSFVQARDLNPVGPRLAYVLTNLAVALSAQQKLAEAMAAYNQALNIQIELKDKRGQALTLQKRGETFNLLTQHTQAIDDLKRALLLWGSVKDPRGRAATLNTLAHVEQDRGNLRDALNYSDEAISIVESQRTTLSSRQLRASYFATQESYYELNIDLNMQLSKSGEAAYVAQAFATAEKARARVLLETLTDAGVDRLKPQQASDPQLASLLDQLHALKAKLAAKAQGRTRLLNGNPNATQLAVLDKEIDALSEKHDSLEAQIRSRHPRFATLTKPQPATLKDTQRQLDDETLLLEYSLGDKRSYLWAVTPNSVEGFELAPREQIEQAALRVIDSLAGIGKEKNESILQQQLRLETQFSDASGKLAKMVLERAVPLLGSKRLVVVADGTLQLVPFAALPLSKNSVPLISEHELIYVPSASVLTLQRQELTKRKPAARAVAVLANPVFELDDERVTSSRKRKPADSAVTMQTQSLSVGSSAPTRSSNRDRDLNEALRDVGVDRLSRLPYSQDEAVAIMNVVPKGEVFAALGFAANRATATSPALSQYRIIHFATHGILNLEHPELSGIVLSLVDKNGAPQDGYLFLDDIYNLNLPAELVVLSACQTGVGRQVKGEGLIALTRGFMYAGAARLVASLWKVNDAATAALMSRFYKEMFINGKKPAAALQAAQLQLREQRRWSSPVYWAGFFIQGEWR
jgi:CHAT domain-containing protein/Tfp pilus assembly protein PilF